MAGGTMILWFGGTRRDERRRVWTVYKVELLGRSEHQYIFLLLYYHHLSGSKPYRSYSSSAYFTQRHQRIHPSRWLLSLGTPAQASSSAKTATPLARPIRT
jgi:hypothetical protein